ncbi:MAG TPA: elongation factor P, partial [Candidatus Saccharibacteria bacterium]|nr:elongation factor P [Candidatus Saccharibacteria bacterium]
MALGVTDLRKGAVFSFEGHPYRVTEYSQKVVGRGGSIVNVTIKSLLDGKVLQKTFKGNEQLDSVDLAYANVQYLYNDGSKFYFMDNESYEQIELNADVIGEQVGFLKEGDTVKAMKLDGTTVSVELPKNVYLEVTYSEDVVKGDTTSSVLKDAT